MEDKKYQVTIQWNVLKNGISVSENHTGRFDTQGEEDTYRDHALSFLPKQTIEEKMEEFVGATPTVDAHICPKNVAHGEMKYRSGVSAKTGNPYAFWSCTQKNPDGSWCGGKA